MLDSKCWAALKKAGFAEVAAQMATEAEKAGAATASLTFHFLKEDDEPDGKFVASFTVAVERVQ